VVARGRVVVDGCDVDGARGGATVVVVAVAREVVGAAAAGGAVDVDVDGVVSSGDAGASCAAARVAVVRGRVVVTDVVVATTT
jgi:hypothetical protein